MPTDDFPELDLVASTRKLYQSGHKTPWTSTDLPAGVSYELELEHPGQWPQGAAFCVWVRSRGVLRLTYRPRGNGPHEHIFTINLEEYVRDKQKAESDEPRP